MDKQSNGVSPAAKASFLKRLVSVLRETPGLKPEPAAEIKYPLLRSEGLLESKCPCGQPVLIEINSRMSSRKDRKRPYFPDEIDRGWMAFRCKRCRGVIHDNVPGAEYSCS